MAGHPEVCSPARHLCWTAHKGVPSCHASSGGIGVGKICPVQPWGSLWHCLMKAPAVPSLLTEQEQTSLCISVIPCLSFWRHIQEFQIQPPQNITHCRIIYIYTHLQYWVYSRMIPWCLHSPCGTGKLDEEVVPTYSSFFKQHFGHSVSLFPVLHITSTLEISHSCTRFMSFDSDTTVFIILM